MKEGRDDISLERIIESVDRVKTHLDGFDFDAFVADDKTYDAVLMQLVNIGELVNCLSSEFREKHHDFPWHEAVGMRNQIAHGYFEIKADRIWKTANDDLPALKQKINSLLKRVVCIRARSHK